MPSSATEILSSSCYYSSRWNTKILLEKARAGKLPNNVYLYRAELPITDDSDETVEHREASLYDVLCAIRPNSGIHLISYAENIGHFCGIIVDARRETLHAYYHNPTGCGLGKVEGQPYYPTYQIFKKWHDADRNNALTEITKPVQQDSVHCGTYTIEFLLTGAQALLTGETAGPNSWTEQRSHNELITLRREHGLLLQAPFKAGYGIEENPLEAPVNIAPELMPVVATEADQLVNILLDQAENAKTETEKQAAEDKVIQAIDLLLNQQRTALQVASLFAVKLPIVDAPGEEATITA